MKFSILRTCTLGAVLAFVVAACGDNPSAFEQQLPSSEPISFAQNSPANGPGACMGDDAYASGLTSGLGSATALNCTANDIYLARAVATAYRQNPGDPWIPIGEGDFITCDEGETFQAQVTADIAQNANSMRTDIGIWIATDGGDAETGACNHYNLVAPPFNTTVDGVSNSDNDSCGDMSAAAQTQVELGTLTLMCEPGANDYVEVGSCIGWTQPGGDVQCPYGGSDAQAYRFGTVPANKSKCNCDPFQLNIIVNKSAYLTVNKACTPTNDAGKFNLQINGTTRNGEQSCGGTTGKIQLPAGTNVSPGAQHNFGEIAGTGTSLADYETTWSCTGGKGSGSGAGPHNIQLNPDDDIVCTITNVRKPRLRVVKVTEPASDPQLFTFTPTGWNSGNTFQLKHGDAAFASAALSPGSYSVAETVPSGWDLVNRACVLTGTATPKTFSTPTATSVQVTLAAGEDVTCTFTNRKRANVIIRKVTNPAASPGTFAFTAAGGSISPANFSLDHGQSQNFNNIIPGVAYTFTETTLPAFYSLQSISCVGSPAQAVPSVPSKNVIITPIAGQTVDCTFTNLYDPPEDTHGCSPGFWTNKNGVSYYGLLPFDPYTYQVKQLFSAAGPVWPSVGNATLFEALNGYKDVSGRPARNSVAGAAEILLRHAIAAYFNEYLFPATFPAPSTAAIVTAVNAAINSGDRDVILKLNDVFSAMVNGYIVAYELGHEGDLLYAYNTGEEDPGFAGCYFDGKYLPE